MSGSKPELYPLYQVQNQNCTIVSGSKPELYPMCPYLRPMIPIQLKFFRGFSEPSWNICKINFTSIYKFGLSVCLSVCLFESNKRQNGWTDRAQIFCGTSRDSREGLWIIKISNICLHKIRFPLIFLKFWKSTKLFVKIRELFLFCFTMYTKRTCSQLI